MFKTVVVYRKFFFVLFACLICFVSPGGAQITRQAKLESDGFKWIKIIDKNNAKLGAETTEGKKLIPLDSYGMIVYQPHHGGCFLVHSRDNKTVGAWSLEGKEIIPLSRGYDSIEKKKEYYGVEKNGLQGACDFNGQEIIAPQYNNLVYSNGFKHGSSSSSVGIVKNQSGVFVYSDTGKPAISSKSPQKTHSTQRLASGVSQTSESPLRPQNTASTNAAPHTNQNIARVKRQAKLESDGFKWIKVIDNNNAKLGAETTDGKKLIPLDSYGMIVYQPHHGGCFLVHSRDNKTVGAWSLEGKEIVPLSRGYDSIEKKKEYFGVEKNGLQGACDFNGQEIIAPQYNNLVYSNGFKHGSSSSSVGIVKNQSGVFVYSDTGKPAISSNSTQKTQSAQHLASGASQASESPKQSQNTTSTNAAPYASGFTPGDKEQYRRSSICLILLTHRDKKYAEEMERVFKEFPLPARYNDHNITNLRVISVRGTQSKRDIDRIVRSNDVAQKVVGKWFNRSNVTGHMNMDLIHERGGYGAFYADYQRARNNVRGTAMLRDEGIELLQNTFVLVCDMDYIDKKKGAGWAAFGMAMLSVGAMTMSAINQQEATNAYLRGDYAQAHSKAAAANAWGTGAAAGAAATSVVADIGGFRVKMKAYLYKLQWNDNLTNRMYNEFWCDSQTPNSDVQDRKKKFNNASNVFTLDYVGKYKTTSSKTTLRSWSDEEQVILDVCERCVNKGIKKLAKSFPVFRPRAPFYFKDGTMYSHIGYKEDVSRGRKYEILQPYKDKNSQICYKRVGKAKAVTPWDNKNLYFDQYFDEKQLGTSFSYENPSVDLHTPGLQLREL